MPEFFRPSSTGFLGSRPSKPTSLPVAPAVPLEGASGQTPSGLAPYLTGTETQVPKRRYRNTGTETRYEEGAVTPLLMRAGRATRGTSIGHEPVLPQHCLHIVSVGPVST
jgi:hypothetical protein